MTVLAWCLMASTGRVSSSMPWVRAVVRSSTTTAGVPIATQLGLIGVERGDAERVAERRRQPHRRAGLQVAVVGAAAQAVEEPRRRCRHRRAERSEQPVAIGGGRLPDRLLDGGAGLPERPGLGIDGQRRLVAEEVPGDRGQHEAELRMGGGDGDDVQGSGEPRLPVAGDDDRGCLVRPVDRHLLGDVVRRGAGQAGGADEDQRLAGQVDVLLVLGGVAGDRPVAELAELDAELLGGDPVGAVADDGPVPLGRRELLGGSRDHGAAADGGLHRRGQVTECGDEGLVDDAADLTGDRPGEQEPSRDLRVEGLRGGDAHLHVPAVGGVEDAVGLVGEVRLATVHDRHDVRSPGAGQVDGAVRVRRGARTG